MRRISIALGTLDCLILLISWANADHIWLNEFHYDNPGGDVGEFVEVGMRTTNGCEINPNDYVVEFYNGSNRQLYDTTGKLDLFDFINNFSITGSSSMITF